MRRGGANEETLTLHGSSVHQKAQTGRVRRVSLGGVGRVRLEKLQQTGSPA